MSFRTELSVDGNTYPIRQVSLEISQTIDAVGRPSSATQGGKIRLEIDVADDDTLSEWMADPHKTLGGSIRYYRTDEDATLKELKFEDAFCVDYIERFDGTQSGQPMTTAITISAQKLKIGQVSVENNWP
ncbi:type VI secretion system tube protein TssD [Spirosoma luteum]|uniref:type VI secretion system tube protein TssD n=1 Tax=Spirosoma luteum TaxID=431553 RepID=UPI00036840C2|nr:type VI secretion system tube protein TssD [Spirosoma luteum]